MHLDEKLSFINKMKAKYNNFNMDLPPKLLEFEDYVVKNDMCEVTDILGEYSQITMRCNFVFNAEYPDNFNYCPGCGKRIHKSS